MLDILYVGTEMLRKYLFSLMLCALPAIADPIGASANFHFTVVTGYSSFHNDSVQGINSLTYSQTSPIGGWLEVDANFSSAHGHYTLDGYLAVGQGVKSSLDGSFSLTTGTFDALISLPASVNGYAVTGTERQIDTNQPPFAQPLKSITANSIPVHFPLDNYSTPYTAMLGTNGDPLLLGIQLIPVSLQYQSGDSIEFQFSINGTPAMTATPEPAARVLAFLGLLALGLVYRLRRFNGLPLTLPQ